MNRITNHLKDVRRRILLSTVLIVIFVFISLVVSIQGTANTDLGFFLRVIPFAGALMILPRNALPSRWPTAETDEDQDLLDMMRGELRSLHSRTIIMRLLYLPTFLVAMLFLPKFGI